MLRYTTDRVRPGLVAFYDIRPGNGAGLFLQPRSPHRSAAGAVGIFFGNNRPRWFGTLVFNGTFRTNRQYRATQVQCISRRAGNNTTIQYWTV